MGAVLRARDPSNNAVAIKVLLPEAVAHPEAIPRFLNEARASRELTSDHAVRVFEFGTLDAGLPFMVMELLDGGDLHTMMEQRGPLPVAEVCDAIIDACDALAEAHARGMVHRDLKPENLFAARRPDGSVCIKVLDFGLSKLAAQARHVALTSTGAFLGSPHYMAPEQLKSAKGVDARADIWSLGVVLYELLTCKLPFDGGSFGQLFMEIVSREAPVVTTHRQDIPPGLVEIIGRCMKKDREQRYADVAMLAEALAQFASPKGAAAARRIAERGKPRMPVPSQPEVGAGGSASSPNMHPSSGKLGGTMLMVNAPPMSAGPRVPAVPGPPSGPALSAPTPSLTQQPQPVATAPSPAAIPAPTPDPTARRPSSSVSVVAIIATLGVLVALAVAGVLLAMSRFRAR